MIRFPDWLASQSWSIAQIVPPHQKLMLALARAGKRGLSRGEIAGLVALENDTLDELLAALVNCGELSLSNTTDGRRVFRRLI